MLNGRSRAAPPNINTNLLTLAKEMAGMKSPLKMLSGSGRLTKIPSL
jgi:hypothetical protein